MKSKEEAKEIIRKAGFAFIANVIENWHLHVASKMRGLANLVECNTKVALGQFSSDELYINGTRADWDTLELFDI